MEIRNKKGQHLKHQHQSRRSSAREWRKEQNVFYCLFSGLAPQKIFMRDRIMENKTLILTDHMVGCARRTHLSPLKEDKTFIIHLWLHCLWIMSLAPFLVGTNLLSQQTAVVVMHFFSALLLGARRSCFSLICTSQIQWNVLSSDIKQG